MRKYYFASNMSYFPNHQDNTQKRKNPKIILSNGVGKPISNKEKLGFITTTKNKNENKNSKIRSITNTLRR